MAVSVRLTTDISGLRDGAPWPHRGETISVSASEARDLLAAGHAEPVKSAKPETASLNK